MQIIFDQKMVPSLQQRYVVLELDTIIQPGMAEPITLYAVIERLDLKTITNLPDLITQHQELITQYKSSNWVAAEGNAYALKGQWHGELDEFYELVIATAQENIKSNTVWTGVRFTVPAT